MDHEHNQKPARGARRPTSSMVRLQRVLADAGVAARRVCEKLIEEGHVEVNGELVTKLPAFVDPRNDKISVDGKPIAKPASNPTGRKLYIILHKPDRTLTTANDEPGLERRTVLDLIDHPAKPRLFPVGRLGWDETGLVLLTNDGELANRLTHPRYGVPKTYLAVVKGDVDEADLHRFSRQMFKLERLASRQEGRIKTSHVDMAVFKREPGKTTLRVTMKEGKNRYVAEVLGQSGFPVRKVAAVSIGPLQLRGLPIGSWRELTRDEIRLLRAACKDDATPEMKSGIKPDQEEAQNLRVPRQWVPRSDGRARGRTHAPRSEGPTSRGTRGTGSRQQRPQADAERPSDDRPARPSRPPETPKPILRSNTPARTIRPPKPSDNPVGAGGSVRDGANVGGAGVYIPPSRRERMKAQYEQVRESRTRKPAPRNFEPSSDDGGRMMGGGRPQRPGRASGDDRGGSRGPARGFGSPDRRSAGGGGGAGGGRGPDRGSRGGEGRSRGDVGDGGARGARGGRGGRPVGGGGRGGGGDRSGGRPQGRSRPRNDR